MRVWFNGRTPAFQADNAGSIPVTRSIESAGQSYKALAFLLFWASVHDCAAELRGFGFDGEKESPHCAGFDFATPLGSISALAVRSADLCCQIGDDVVRLVHRLAADNEAGDLLLAADAHQIVLNAGLSGVAHIERDALLIHKAEYFLAERAGFLIVKCMVFQIRHRRSLRSILACQPQKRDNSLYLTKEMR